MNNEQIINKLKRNDVDSIKIVFDNYYKLLCTYAMHFGLSLFESEDIVQEVIISFWSNKKGTNFQGSVKSYLYGAVGKASLKAKQKKVIYDYNALDLYVDKWIDEIVLSQDGDWETEIYNINRHINELPCMGRIILLDIAVNHLTYKDVAIKHGVSINTVKTHYSRTLKRLRDRIKRPV